MKPFPPFNKQIAIEGLIVTLFIGTLSLIFYTISQGEILNLWVLISMLVSASYLSLIGVYSTLKKEYDHTITLLIGHTIGFILSGLFMRLGLVQFAILMLFAVIYALFIYGFLRTMHNEVANRIFFHPRKIVFPAIHRFIIGFIFIVSIFVYFQSSQTGNTNAYIQIPEELITSQAPLLSQFIQQVEPLYQQGMTVEELLIARIEQSIEEQQNLNIPSGTQLVDVPEDVKDQLLQNELTQLERQYSVELQQDEDVLLAVVGGLNRVIENFFGQYLSPILRSLLSALLIFLGLIWLMPVYNLLIKLGIASTSWIFVKINFIELEEEVVTKHIMKI